MRPVVPYASKFFYAVAGFALIAGVIAAWAAHGGLSGGASYGLLGGIGDHVAVTVLGFLAAAGAFLGALTTAFRDVDNDAAAAVARLERLPEATPPGTNNFWPAIGAVSVGLMMIGLASSPVLFRFGAVFAGIAVIEWAVHAWADRATGDPETNREIRNRFMYPVEIPLFGALGIIVVVVCVSRVLLAVSEVGSDLVAAGMALTVLGVATVLSLRPQLKRSLVATVLVVFAVAVIAAGIVGAAHGTREYEKIGGKQGTTTTEPSSTSTTESGLAGPAVLR